MSAAWRAKDFAALSNAIAGYRGKLEAEKVLAKDLQKAGREQFFNHIEPFYRGMVISLTAFLFVALLFPEKF